MKFDHIETEQVADGVNVTIEDRELLDYIEDVLIEHGLEPRSVAQEERDGRSIHILCFGADAPADQIEAILAAIPATEIERIWRLNN
jgi:hypothetical protein